MSIDLYQEVKSSFVLRAYNLLSKVGKAFIPYFKWTAGILFIIGFLDVVINTQPHKLVMWANIVVWTPGLLFAFIAGGFHFATGRKLKYLSKKYSINQNQLQREVYDILNK